MVFARADEERVVELSEELIGTKLRAGDAVLMDTRSQLLIESSPARGRRAGARRGP